MDEPLLPVTKHQKLTVADLPEHLRNSSWTEPSAELVVIAPGLSMGRLVYLLNHVHDNGVLAFMVCLMIARMILLIGYIVADIAVLSGCASRDELDPQYVSMNINSMIIYRLIILVEVVTVTFTVTYWYFSV